MKIASSPVRPAALKALLFAIVFGAVFTTFAQSSDDSTAQTQTPSASSTSTVTEAQTPPATEPPAPAAPASRYVSPFSMSAIPAFSYTNLTNFNPAIARSSLTINPFSRLPMNPDTVEAAPAPQLPVFEPLPPPNYELPPGASIRTPIPAPLAEPAKPIVPAPAIETAASAAPPVAFEYYPNDYTYTFPPGAFLRRR